MKKVFIVLFILVLFSITVLADGIDLNSFSDVELLELYNRLETELTNRNLFGEHLYVGDYICGEDLIPGRYVLSVVEAYESKYADVYVEAQVYELNPSTAQWKRIYAEDLYHPGEKCSFVLKEGQKFTVCNGEFEILSIRQK